MNVGRLKKVLEGLPDDAPVLVTASDHNYRPASWSIELALKEGRDQYSEYWEEVDGGGETVKALVLS